ncbi:hypothetical protein NDK47_14255 [Brevibacillus ruminantium]|uniref:Uncharacterized protein n=1 Tax=Brevibacillus ruminantium TaxID=2950604 RepID=A0ABY4W8G4_9BACL|nr:hypothetical protein [Brevibacillus ruminantium]USG63348.1 hypothetical protein NDK47_14255 [Brevibacillus ruminantium]
MNGALEAGVAFINCISVFIASDPEWVANLNGRDFPSSAMISNLSWVQRSSIVF